MDKIGSPSSLAVNDSSIKEDQLECEERILHGNTTVVQSSLKRMPSTCLSASANDSKDKKEEPEYCKQLIIDIPQAAHEPPLWPECCIYRVPKRLREVMPIAYTPRLVSIGPFHRRIGEELMKDMEIQKFRYLMDFCYRTGKRIEELACIIHDNEERIRRCYSETFPVNSEQFIRMILLDAIFILELFWRKSIESKADYILSQPSMKNGIKHDLLLLENQLPFFVLVKLYSCGDQHNEAGNILLEQSSQFFDICNPQLKPEKIGEVKHLTDLLRSFFRPSNPIPGSNDEIDYTTSYSATKLDEAGLKFRRPTSTRSLLEIQMRENYCLEKFPIFNLSWLFACLPCLKSTCLERMQRVLEIPPLIVDDSTEGLFRNLMAFEQCHYTDETYICEYVTLLDDLITTEADVSLLVDKKIIVNLLGSSVAVTNLFNGLGQEIQLDLGRPFYAKLYEDLQKYCGNDWNRLVGTLTRVYFTDFFKGTATLAGIIVVVITVWNFCKDL